MTTASTDSPPIIMAPHRKLTVAEYHRMGEAGILREDDRVELIEGELIDMAPIGHLHASLTSTLNEYLTPRLIGRAIAWIQNPIQLAPYSEPQPDFALLRYQPHRYRHILPAATDVLLVVEIADTTVHYDREIKGPLYARHGIPEYWLINLPGQFIEVYFEPEPENACYQTVQAVTEGQLAPQCFPEVILNVREFLS
ncbi:protein of unknown function DUF820 [Nitrosococcus halophilus Nc 4]|uniref:Putative restriction endonuclease domain-containing protein n=1 Tax=Nitrosococcus halophilus (strain Nc4) TaxID=472759 RepID=D5C0J0_NITHN|nr:Uma2 family endonuclease [Nitrosococcus halophilus]ADE14516.1 protein of unknown function DUF820 [Nitrosococcus halophilus Nc 4]